MTITLTAAVAGIGSGSGIVHASPDQWLEAATALARVAKPPLGLPPVPGFDAHDPTAVARIALGRKLFFDSRLSRDGDLSCASCHVPARAFADNRSPTAKGRGGRLLGRNAPSLLNVAYASTLFRDGRARSLEAQIAGPLFGPDEMANASDTELVARLASLQDYRNPFRRAFGGRPTMARIASAIAAFERTLISGNSPFDRWYFGREPDAISAKAKRGHSLFVGKGGCVACHKIGIRHALFTDDGFHFTGTGYRTVRLEDRQSVKFIAGAGAVPIALTELAVFGGDSGLTRGRRSLDLGRQEVTGDPADQWRYRTPNLRNVALTAPYMHDGSFATLEEVVRYYNYTGVWHPRLDPRIRPIGLTEEQIAAMVAFLESLTGENSLELFSPP